MAEEVTEEMEVDNKKEDATDEMEVDINEEVITEEMETEISEDSESMQWEECDYAEQPMVRTDTEEEIWWEESFHTTYLAEDGREVNCSRYLIDRTLQRSVLYYTT